MLFEFRGKKYRWNKDRFKSNMWGLFVFLFFIIAFIITSMLDWQILN